MTGARLAYAVSAGLITFSAVWYLRLIDPPRQGNPATAVFLFVCIAIVAIAAVVPSWPARWVVMTLTFMTMLVISAGSVLSFTLLPATGVGFLGLALEQARAARVRR